MSGWSNPPFPPQRQYLLEFQTAANRFNGLQHIKNY
nr:MAG TPA: hypothetical protein [Caudoviricetes sp.]